MIAINNVKSKDTKLENEIDAFKLDVEGKNTY